MVQGGTTMSVDIQWFTELCLGVQFYVEECKGVYLCTTEHDDTQQVVGMLPPERSRNGDVKSTIRFGTPRFGERVDHRVDHELPFITLQHCTLTQRTWLLSLDALIMRNRTQEVHLRQLNKTQFIRRKAFQLWHMVNVLVGRCRLGDGLICRRGSTCSTLEPTFRGAHDTYWARHSEMSQEHIQWLVDPS